MLGLGFGLPSGFSLEGWFVRQPNEVPAQSFATRASSECPLTESRDSANAIQGESQVAHQTGCFGPCTGRSWCSPVMLEATFLLLQLAHVHSMQDFPTLLIKQENYTYPSGRYGPICLVCTDLSGQ